MIFQLGEESPLNASGFVLGRLSRFPSQKEHGRDGTSLVYTRFHRETFSEFGID